MSTAHDLLRLERRILESRGRDSDADVSALEAARSELTRRVYCDERERDRYLELLAAEPRT